MTNRKNWRSGFLTGFAILTMVALLLAAQPVEANLLGRAIGVGGVGHSLKTNFEENLGALNQMFDGFFENNQEKVADAWNTVKDTPRRLIVHAFPVLDTADALRGRVGSAKAKVKRFVGRARDTVGGVREAVSDARAALAINRDEWKWYKSKAKILDGRPLPVATRSQFVRPTSVVPKPTKATAKADSKGDKSFSFKKWTETEQNARPDCYGAVSNAKAAECDRDPWAAASDPWAAESEARKAEAAKASREPQGQWGSGTEPAARDDDSRKSAEESKSEYEKALAATLGGDQPKASTDGDYMAALTDLEAKEAERKAGEEAERRRLEEERRAREVVEAQRFEEDSREQARREEARRQKEAAWAADLARREADARAVTRMMLQNLQGTLQQIQEQKQQRQAARRLREEQRRQAARAREEQQRQAVRARVEQEARAARAREEQQRQAARARAEQEKQAVRARAMAASERCRNNYRLAVKRLEDAAELVRRTQEEIMYACRKKTRSLADCEFRYHGYMRRWAALNPPPMYTC